MFYTFNGPFCISDHPHPLSNAHWEPTHAFGTTILRLLRPFNTPTMFCNKCFNTKFNNNWLSCKLVGVARGSSHLGHRRLQAHTTSASLSHTHAGWGLSRLLFVILYVRYTSHQSNCICLDQITSLMIINGFLEYLTSKNFFANI